MGVAGVLQEAGDADAKARTRFQMYAEYNIILYTSSPTRLPHSCLGYHDNCVVTANIGGMGRLGVVHLC